MNADGHGPAWSNSLFEDNAEHGMGMLLGYEAVQDKVVVDSEALIECGGAAGDLADAARAWLRPVPRTRSWSIQYRARLGMLLGYEGRAGQGRR